jgi:hypothetical protein
MGEGGLFIDVTGGMVLAKHPERAQVPAMVAPTDDATKALNTIRAPLIAIACWKLPDHFFDFDSSVVVPESKGGFAKFFDLRKDLVDAKTGLAPPLTIFGHADPVGKDAYNSTLSSRRAAAVHALFTRNTDVWEFLYSDPQGTGDIWGRKSLQVMLGALPSQDGTPFFTGKADGVWSQAWSDAIRAFQQEHQPDSVTGEAGTPVHRKPIFAAYMDFLCADSTGKPFQLSATDDFLARNQGKNFKGDLQGCGEFNPSLLFSKSEERSFKSKEERNAQNRPNRRVVVYLFKPGTSIDPEKWPCPAFREDGKEAAKKCVARFWKDGNDRRSRQEEDARRTFRESEDTFACRFYQGFAARSPCEGIVHLWVLRIQETTEKTLLGRAPLANRRCVVTLGAEADAAIVRTDTDANGTVHLPVLDDRTKMTLKVDPAAKPAGPNAGAPASGDPEAEAGEASFIAIALDGGALEALPPDKNQDLAVKQRLHNLGLGPANLASWTDADLQKAVRAFRAQQRLPASDSADDDDFRQALRREYGDEDPGFKPPEDG